MHTCVYMYTYMHVHTYIKVCTHKYKHIYSAPRLQPMKPCPSASVVQFMLRAPPCRLRLKLDFS